MARPTDDPKTVRMDLRLSPSFVDFVDEWRRHQPDIPPRSEAIRRLVVEGFLADDRTHRMTATVRLLGKLWDDGRLTAEELHALYAEWDKHDDAIKTLADMPGLRAAAHPVTIPEDLPAPLHRLLDPD